jgi:hypothetical protein
MLVGIRRNPVKVVTALAATVLICVPVRSGLAQSNRFIDALITAPSLVAYTDDGAADATVTNVGANAAGVVDHPIPQIRDLLKLGASAIPLLIAHLDDTRLTSATFGTDKVHVPVGHVA